MDRDINLDLAHYRDLRNYKPKIGDIIIKHGWIRRTVWFGVISLVDKSNNMVIVRNGLPKLLLLMSPESMKQNTVNMSINELISSVPGSYSIIQCESPNSVNMWYV